MTNSVNYILFKEDGKMLIQKRDMKNNISCPGMWAIPGGAIEEGEDNLAALIREIYEETGIEVSEGDCKHLGEITYTWGKTATFYTVHTKEDEAKSNEGEMCWKDLTEVRTLELCDKQKDILELLNVMP